MASAPHCPRLPQRGPSPAVSRLSAATGHVVALGASAGGLRAISAILAELPATFPAPIVIVQHLSPHTPSQMARILSQRTLLAVKQAEEGDRLLAGTVYIAPPARHLVVCPDKSLSLIDTPKVHHSRPSADVLFLSLATNVGSKAVGVVLTGGDGDGTAGIEAIKAAGGTTFAQDEQSSQNFSMPRHAAATGAIDFVLPVTEIAPTLVALMSHPAAMPKTEDTKREDTKREDTKATGTVLDRVQAAWQQASDFLEANPHPDQINRLVTKALVEMADCLGALGMAEQALLEQNRTLAGFSRQLGEERLLRRTLLTAVSEGVIVTDADGVMREVNPAAAKLLGRSVKGLVGRPLSRLSSKRERFAFESAMRMALKSADYPQKMDFSVMDFSVSVMDLSARGGLPAVRATPFLFRNEQGVLIGLIWLLRADAPELDAPERE